MIRFTCRRAELKDLDQLVAIELASFSADKLSKRSFRRHLQSDHSDLMVAQVCSLDLTHQTDNSASLSESQLLGYGLTFRRRGTRLARLYSLAVLPEARGFGVAHGLLAELEQVAVREGRLYMRLEVAKNNAGAIQLYRDCGYRVFGEYNDYYEDHSDALRMQKIIRRVAATGVHRATPWYRQSTEFSCGPAALIMAMASFNTELTADLALELSLWREATTVFMTSGHGGCHPFGLALAAHRRGFSALVWVNSEQPLFVDGVRSEHKKAIMSVVHQQFLDQCRHNNIEINFTDIDQFTVEHLLRNGYAVLVLISTYRLEGRKAPHWVVVTGIDSDCLYVHDPDPDNEQSMEYEQVPIARDDFAQMSAYGSSRLRAAVAIKYWPLNTGTNS